MVEVKLVVAAVRVVLEQARDLALPLERITPLPLEQAVLVLLGHTLVLLLQLLVAIPYLVPLHPLVVVAVVITSPTSTV